MASWRVAKSLLTLRDQVNARWPSRNKASDGTIGDAAHSSRQSDHNPNSDGVVCAMDITHDPKSGCDTWVMFDRMVAQRDSRIKYIISNWRICNSSDWKVKKYTGSNSHSMHIHISVKPPKQSYDDTRAWGAAVASGSGTEKWPDPTIKKGSKGPAVTKCQTMLRDSGGASSLTVDGDFGPETDTAVRRFQKEKGLTVDGIVGPKTWDALGELHPDEND